MGAPTVRRYRPSDRPAIEDLMRVALVDADAYFPDAAEDASPRLIEEYYQPPAGDLVVAERGEELVGTAAMREPAGHLREYQGHFEPEVAELKRMYVHPDAQGNGIGRRLLAEIATRARDAGYEEFVFTTTSLQTTATAFYERFGFERFDEEPLTADGRSFRLLYYRGPIPDAV